MLNHKAHCDENIPKNYKTKIKIKTKQVSDTFSRRENKK